MRRALDLHFGAAAMAAAVLTLSGCGKAEPLGQVEGVVRLDGQPLGLVRITFWPEKGENGHRPCSTAVADDQGRYRLYCDDGREGAAIGTHSVVIEDAHANSSPRKKGEGDDEEPSVPASSRVPARFKSTQLTPLKQKVEAGLQTITLDLNTGT